MTTWPQGVPARERRPVRLVWAQRREKDSLGFAVEAALRARGLAVVSVERAAPTRAVVAYRDGSVAFSAASAAPETLRGAPEDLDDWLYGDLLLQVDARRQPLRQAVGAP